MFWKKGFTIIELVAIFVALGFLAVSYVTLKSNIPVMAIDAASRQIQSDLRWAHQQSIAKGLSYGGKFEAGVGYKIFEGSETNVVTSPITGALWIDDLSKYHGVGITNNLTVVFNKYGEPTQGGDTRLRLETLEGDQRDIYVVDETGLVVIDVLGVGSGCRCNLCYEKAFKKD